MHGISWYFPFYSDEPCKENRKNKDYVGFGRRSVHDWWPDDDDQGDDGNKKKQKQACAGLFLPGQGRRKKRVPKAKGKAAKAAKEKEKTRTSKKGKKAKKAAKAKGKNRLKKAKAVLHVHDVLTNYRRQGVGVVLIGQQMEKAKYMDDTKFSHNLLFTVEDGTCRMKVASCNGVSWETILANAHPYLKAQLLGCYTMLRYA